MRIWFVVFAGAALVGCVTPRQMSRGRVAAQDRSAAWQRALVALQTRGYPVTLANEAGGVVTAGPASTLIPCGLIRCDVRKTASVSIMPDGSVLVNIDASVYSTSASEWRNPWTNEQVELLEQEQDELIREIGGTVDPRRPSAGQAGMRK